MVPNIWTWKASTLASEGIIEGNWFVTGAGRSVPAHLTVDADGVAEVTDANGGRLAGAHFARLAVSDRVGRIARRIEFPGAGIFETGDNDGIDRIVATQRGRRAGLIHGLEQFHPRLIAFVVLTVLLCAALYRFALPAMVEVAVAVTPPVVPQLMSEAALASLDQSVLAPTELAEARQAAIRSDFHELADVARQGAAGFDLQFREGGAIGPNAFALPDGTIIVTDELVRLAGDRTDMVLAVLAHEIGHVEQEHSLRQLYRAAGLVGLVMLIGGDIGAGAEELLVQGSALLTLSYSRAQEAEADRYSVDLMRKTGRDPKALVPFFEILQQRFGDTGSADFLSTHPATPARIEAIRRYAEGG